MDGTDGADDNEYLREFLGLTRQQAAGDYHAWLRQPARPTSFERRMACVRRYAFGVPNRAALEAIARRSPIVELGAGTGYWAYLLRARGVDILAYDLAPPDQAPNAYQFEPRTWTRVERGGVDVLQQHPASALLLCWPGYKDDFADRALAAYGGRCLIYVGEPAGGNTANEEFFERLTRGWSLAQRVRIPRWPGAHDSLNIYDRRRPI